MNLDNGSTADVMGGRRNGVHCGASEPIGLDLVVLGYVADADRFSLIIYLEEIGVLRFLTRGFGLFIAPVLLANTPFTARDFELAARFVANIQENRFDAAKRMMAEDVVIRSWDAYAGPAKTFEEFASFLVRCPVHDFEGVATEDARNINVNLNCPSYGNASIEFRGGKISQITYGGPPPLIRLETR